MDLNLCGKAALVTAGSKGMGRAIALAFATEGMKIAISARGEEALAMTVADARAAGAEVIGIAGDVAEARDIDRMIAGTVDAYGGIDVLVVNAGGPPSMAFAQATDADWTRAFELTLMSAVRLIRAVVPYLSQSRGTVVTIESISVKQPVSGLLLSNTIRPSVVGLTKTLADELGPQGIRLNNILPGMILTDRSVHLAEGRAKASGRTAEEVIAETEQAIPLGRYGKPEEIANLALFLASSASSYITGTSILCDGGIYRGLM
jgi:3-oxoacyl-[acyl-carrier protein] reductase